MERNIASLRFGVEGPVLSAGNSASRCDACGEAFEQPLLAMVFSDTLVEEYYACPKCLSKVASLAHQKDFEVDEAEQEAVDEPLMANVAAEAVEGPSGCMHELGYLKRRAKSEPIPEECLTCSQSFCCRLGILRV